MKKKKLDVWNIFSFGPIGPINKQSKKRREKENDFDFVPHLALDKFDWNWNEKILAGACHQLTSWNFGRIRPNQQLIKNKKIKK